MQTVTGGGAAVQGPASCNRAKLSKQPALQPSFPQRECLCYHPRTASAAHQPVRPVLSLPSFPDSARKSTPLLLTQAFSGHDRATFQVVHHQQHLVAAAVVHHLPESK